MHPYSPTGTSPKGKACHWIRRELSATENPVTCFPVERCRRQKGCISSSEARLLGFRCRQAAYILIAPKGETTHYILCVADAPTKCVRCAPRSGDTFPSEPFEPSAPFKPFDTPKTCQIYAPFTSLYISSINPAIHFISSPVMPFLLIFILAILPGRRRI